MDLSRRSFLVGALAAPAIVPIKALMPLRGVRLLPFDYELFGIAPWMTLMLDFERAQAEILRVLHVPPQYLRA